MAAHAQASTTHNFSVRDIAKTLVPSTVLTSSVIRRQRGSKDLRKSQDQLSSNMVALSSASASPRSSTLHIDETFSSTPTVLECPPSCRLSCDELMSPQDDSPTTSVFEDDSDDEIEPDSEPEPSPSPSFYWMPGEEWPLPLNQSMPYIKHHKDSAISIDFQGFETGPDSAKRLSSSAVTVSSDADPVAMRSRHSSTTNTRTSSIISQNHEQQCICRICRHLRHKRRKTALCLFEKLEDCRYIMMTIRDPNNLTNLERGVAYGHWLKLARLYVKYETLLDTDVDDFSGEEQLFIDYLKSYNALVDLVKEEAKKWSHLFDGRVDHGTVAVKTAGAVRAVDVDASNTPAGLPVHRTTSWTMDKQSPIGNCRAVGSSFF